MHWRSYAATIGTAALLCSAAWAGAQWMKLFAEVYKPKATTALAKAKCAVCHMRLDGSGGLNPYGKLLNGKPVERRSLRVIEKLDADKDKFSNIAEITAGTLPGSAKSKPQAAR